MSSPVIPSSYPDNPQHYGVELSLGMIWDVPTLLWVKSTGGAAGGGLTNAELRATPVPVSGTVTATGPLTDAQLRASAVPVSGPLTDTQLRATPVPVSGTVTATGPLTDTQLRATPVPVSGTIAAVTSITNPVSTKTDLTPAAPTAASVGVASAQAVAANASRKGLILTNVSNARISFGLGSAAVLDSGITLYPGGVAEMDEFWFDTGAVNAIASAAASPLAIQELS